MTILTIIITNNIINFIINTNNIINLNNDNNKNLCNVVKAFLWGFIVPLKLSRTEVGPTLRLRFADGTAVVAVVWYW